MTHVLIRGEETQTHRETALRRQRHGARDALASQETARMTGVTGSCKRQGTDSLPEPSGDTLVLGFRPPGPGEGKSPLFDTIHKGSPRK